METQGEKIFVYGTLRRGFELHSELKSLGARYLGKGRIQGKLFDLGEFPGLIQAPEHIGSSVEGEIYELQNPSEQLAVLDRLEEFDSKKPNKSLFIRKKAVVKLKQGGHMRAWVYFLPRKPRRAAVIESGNYADVRHP